MSGNEMHLDGVTLQAYLDGEVAESQRTRLEAHLAECARCTAELQGWRTLLEELDELPDLVGPRPGFGELVLDRVGADARVRPSLGARIRGALSGRKWAGGRHGSPGRLQELLDGVLLGPERERLLGHLAGCAACRDEVVAWQSLHRTLDALPTLGPSEGFETRVMERFRASEAPVQEQVVPGGIPEWSARLLPSTRRGWGFAAFVIIAPVVGALVLVGAILLHPLLSPGSLLAFLSWQASGLLQGLWSWAIQQAAGNVLLGLATAWLRTAIASPGITIPVLAVAWLSTLGAAWIVYRNVVAPSAVANRHAQASQ